MLNTSDVVYLNTTGKIKPELIYRNINDICNVM